MLKWKILLMAGILVLTILAVTGYIQGRNATAACKFQPQSLVGASLDEIKKAALDFTCAKFEILSGTPQIRLARFITPVEFMSMFGEGRSDAACQDQQLALVILKGDFKEKGGAFPGYGDTSNLPPLGYIGLVFDLRVGIPTGFIGSPHGEKFRTVLNDPTIPTEIPAPTPPTDRKLFAVPTLPNPEQMRPCSYGTIAPTIVPPITPILPPPTPTQRPYLPPPP